jgi:hypothetical protein
MENMERIQSAGLRKNITNYAPMSGDILWDVVGLKTATDIISCH